MNVMKSEQKQKGSTRDSLISEEFQEIGAASGKKVARLVDPWEPRGTQSPGTNDTWATGP